MHLLLLQNKSHFADVLKPNLIRENFKELIILYTYYLFTLLEYELVIKLFGKKVWS